MCIKIEIMETHRRRTKRKFLQLRKLCPPCIFIVLATLSYGVTGQTPNGSLSSSPFGISIQDFSLKVGESSSDSLYTTDSFNHTFTNETTVTLIFVSDHPGVVSPLPNVTFDNSENTSSINITALNAGKTLIKTYYVSTDNDNRTLVPEVFLRVSVYKLAILIVISDIVGWIYFAAWSISFYPQIYQNYRRKSVRGLSLDFVYLNITGFAVYGIFNVGLFWIKSVQDEYMTRFPFGTLPVQLNDVVFTIHAIVVCTITLYQCHIYDRGSQVVSKTGKTILCGIFTFLFIILIVASSSGITWFIFLSMCSYVKLFITLIKYIPQAHLNWSRKSTSGWCIGNVLLDLTGGFFSILQMFLLAINHNDWASIFGDFTKFGLGLFSICFDMLFIIQHYVLYRNHAAYEPIEGTTNPTAEPKEDIVTSNQQPNYEGSETPISPPIEDTIPIYAKSDTGEE